MVRVIFFFQTHQGTISHQNRRPQNLSLLSCSPAYQLYVLKMLLVNYSISRNEERKGHILQACYLDIFARKKPAASHSPQGLTEGRQTHAQQCWVRLVIVLAVSHTWKQIIGQSRGGHSKGTELKICNLLNQGVCSLDSLCILPLT